MNSSAKNIRLIFGLKLRQLRLNNRYSLAELSNRTGISKSYLNEIEKGKKYPKPKKISILANTLNEEYSELVSLRLQKKLAPISQLIETNVLDALPLDFFGIDQSGLIELLSEAPTKVSAFINSVINIARKYDIQVEHFYYAVLRSYQEMHDNYFPEIEENARQFRKKYAIRPGSLHSIPILEKYLTQQCGYNIIPDGLSAYPKIRQLRYLVVNTKKGNRKLLLNKNISKIQLLFILGREAGFNFLIIKERSATASWVDSDSFEQVLSNFKAHYFSSAILLHEKIFLRGLIKFISKKQFNKQSVINLINNSNASPEAFMLRITSLVPRYLKFNEFFFFRYNHNLEDNSYQQTKELYASGLRNVEGVDLFSKACQRWVAITSLSRYENKNSESDMNEREKANVYRITYEKSGMEFLVIGISDNMKPTESMNCFIGIGFLINTKFKEKTMFVDDPDISKVVVAPEWIISTSKFCYDGLENIMAMNRESLLKSMQKSVREAIEKEKQ